MAVTPKHAVAIKHVYEPASHSDGFRVLVERLWPRCVRKDDAAIDLWLKNVAPSAELRVWYGHVVERWPEFRRRYVRVAEGFGRRRDPPRASATRQRDAGVAILERPI